MAIVVAWNPESDRRFSLDSTLGFAKRAAKHDSGLCLVCGRRATGRCSKCAIATFCGPHCQEAAQSTHAGACESACRVLAGRGVQRGLPPSQMSVLQHMIVLVGQTCNPVSSGQDRGLQGCMAVLEYVSSHPELLQRRVADLLLTGCQALTRDRICANPHIFTFCVIDSCLKMGGVEAFAESAGLSTGAELSSQDRNQRYMEWQKKELLPMQEMFGQIGIGRYWESEAAPIEAGMAPQHTSQLASWHAAQGAGCKVSTASWVSRHSASSQLFMDRAQSIPAHV